MSEKPTSNKDKTVHVSELTHGEVKKHLDKEGVGGDIGKFFDKAAIEKLSRLKNQNSFSRLDSNFLLSNGWVKDMLSRNTYVKGKSVITYTGTSWLCDGEFLTEENFEEKLNTKTPDV